MIVEEYKKYSLTIIVLIIVLILLIGSCASVLEAKYDQSPIVQPSATTSSPLSIVTVTGHTMTE